MPGDEKQAPHVEQALAELKLARELGQPDREVAARKVLEAAGADVPKAAAHAKAAEKRAAAGQDSGSAPAARRSSAHQTTATTADGSKE
jgi:predicted nicotinamide N-methyase